MPAIIKYFWHICLLREGPERIPPSKVIAVVFTTVYFLLGLYSLSIGYEERFGNLVAMTFISISLEGLMLFGALALKSAQKRFTSTFIAIVGCSILLTLISIVIKLAIVEAPEGWVEDFLFTMLLTVLLWWFIIAGFIIHKAMAISLIQAICLAFAIQLSVEVVILQLFPTT